MFNLKKYSVLISCILSLIVLAFVISFLSKSKMGGFQKIILMVAIITLFITLIIVSYALHTSKSSNWPPTIPGCPDYWITDGSGNNVTCTNVKNLGTCKPSSGSSHLIMNFNKPPFTGTNGNCAKYTWANNCQVAWDGLTYGANNPCV